MKASVSSGKEVFLHESRRYRYRNFKSAALAAPQLANALTIITPPPPITTASSNAV
jgi:hypothetical protein